MNKFYSLVAAAVLVPALAVATANPAAAQRRNTTSHDVKPVDLTATVNETAPATVKSVDNNGCNCGKDAKCMKKCGKMMKHDNKMMKKDGGKNWGKHHDKMMKEQSKEINEDYSKAMRKIDNSGFNAEQKELLKKQAAENRDFSMKQMAERQKMMEKHMQARKAMNMQDMMQDKANRKAVKKVSKIGLDD